MLSNERLTAIQALRAAITPPPWTQRSDMCAIYAPPFLVAETNELVESGYPDAAFIAAAPQIVDDLLAERAALLTRLAELEQKRLYTDWG